jgi:membrane protein required for colicin V production
VTLDLLCLLVLFLGAVIGAMSGAVRQLFQLGVVVGAALGARFFSEPVAAALGGVLPKAAARPVGAALLFVALVIALGLVSRLVVGAAEAAGALRGPVDRGLGALLSGAKTALTLWVALSALTLWGGSLPLKRVDLHTETSDFAAFARELNLIEKVKGSSAAARAAAARGQAAAAQEQAAARNP